MAEDNLSGGRGSIDPHHPYFLHSSDNPDMVLVSKPFDGMGFGAWKRAMEVALTAKNKLGFVNGTFKKPTQIHLICISGNDAMEWLYLGF